MQSAMDRGRFERWLGDANFGGKPGLGLTRDRYRQVATEDERL